MIRVVETEGRLIEEKAIMGPKKQIVTNPKDNLTKKTPKVRLVQEVDIEEGEEMVEAKMVKETMGRSSVTIVTRWATIQTNVLRSRTTIYLG